MHGIERLAGETVRTYGTYSATLCRVSERHLHVLLKCSTGVRCNAVCLLVTRERLWNVLVRIAGQM